MRTVPSRLPHPRRYSDSARRGGDGRARLTLSPSRQGAGGCQFVSGTAASCQPKTELGLIHRPCLGGRGSRGNPCNFLPQKGFPNGVSGSGRYPAGLDGCGNEIACNVAAGQ
jgi:hypothetical protein